MQTKDERHRDHSVYCFSVPKDFQSFLLPPPLLVCLFNRMGRLGNHEAFLKVITNKKIKIEMTSYEQVSQGNNVTELSILAG